MTDTIIGTLFDDLTVSLHPRTLEFGGAWNPDATAYELDMLRRFYRWANGRTNTVLLDVGASTGAYCLLAAHVPGMRAYAFEPVMDVYTTLCENVSLNDLSSRIVPVNHAVARHQKTGRLYVVEPASQRALSIVDGTPGQHKQYHVEDILITSLDMVCVTYRLHVDVIKVDVEGGELFALEGARGIIERDHPALIIEYNAENTAQYGYNPDSIETLIREYGYSSWRVDGGNLYTSEFF